jgi:translation initiation factor IF-2
MAESTEKTGEKKLSIASSKTLTLKPRGSETGVVRQSFSHGRTKAVVVEKVRSRAPGKPRIEPAPAPTPAKRAPAAGKAAEAPMPVTTAPPATVAPPKSSGVVLHSLTDDERARRAHALGDARLREAEERKIAEEEARIREQRAAAERAERIAAEARKREEDERHRHYDEIKRK